MHYCDLKPFADELPLPAQDVFLRSGFGLFDTAGCGDSRRLRLGSYFVSVGITHGTLYPG